jgi:hypothetical protein
MGVVPRPVRRSLSPMRSRQIAPDYSFRFTTEDIEATYHSAEGAFAHGDFLNAAQWAPAQSELKGCSLVLGGLLEQGLAILDGLPDMSGRARLCHAFALWSLNRTADAKDTLARSDDQTTSEAVRKFQTLLGRDNVTIFLTGAILSVFPEHYSASFIAPVYKYGAITVKYVGSQLAENAYDYSPTESLSAFIDGLPLDEQPDILFSLSPQWLLAKDFHDVNVPKVIWCHDSDAFQYRNVDNFALYDVAICNCSQEHFELSQGTPDLYCAANMLLHPLATPFPEASPHGEKQFDIIFTGSALAPFHSEKPRFLFNLAELGSKYTVKVIEGHMPEKDYFELISHAKFLPVVNRYAGSPSPRWRDALANGAFLLYPQGTFYGEIAPGCFPFRAETMVGDIARHLDRFEQGREPAYDLSTVVPEVNARFAIHRQAREESYQRLLKYALFMGLVWPHAATARMSRQRRLVWLTPAVDCGLFGTNHVRDLIDHIGEHIDEGDLLDDVDYNNAAHLHAQAVFTFHEGAKAEMWGARADDYFARGLARFPDSLLLLFNEAHWSFFKPDADVHAAERKFHSILERFDNLVFDVHGADVAFAYTLHERDAVFPCYEYADVATSELVLRRTPELRSRKQLEHGTRDIILAACHGYVGWAKLKSRDTAGGLAWLKYAVELYPHGLPTQRLYFDTLLRVSAEAGKLTPALASDLAEAFIAVVNINPSILLTHVYTIVPILADNGERQAAKDVLAAWHRLANIVHKLRTDDEQHQLALLALLWDYRSLLPDSLLERIDEGLWDLQAMQGLTQLERRFIEVARTSTGRERKSGWLTRRSRKATADHVARLLAESGYGQEKVAFANIRRALVLWRRAPPEVKGIYLNKTYRMARRGEFMQALRRMQQWSTVSKWARSESMTAPPRRRWKRLYELLGWWMQLGKSPHRGG